MQRNGARFMRRSFQIIGPRLRVTSALRRPPTSRPSNTIFRDRAVHKARVIFRFALLPMAFVLSVCATGGAQQGPPELIVTNARVHTLDEQRKQASAFAIKDGKFAAVGSDAEIAVWRSEK